VDQDAAYLSPTEIRRALDRLGRADIVRLSAPSLFFRWLQAIFTRAIRSYVSGRSQRTPNA
jgi:hypothetical protein